MDLQEFLHLPIREREKHIHNHEWYLGLERKAQVGFGNAFGDFCQKILRLKLNEPCLEILKKINDGDYHHCVTCSYLFEGDFIHKKEVGQIPKELMDLPDVLNISSGLCNYCNVEKNCERISKKLYY